MTHLKHPVALKKTSGSIISLVLLQPPSDQPEKGMITQSVRTGRASCINSSFNSSVEERFQSSPRKEKDTSRRSPCIRKFEIRVNSSKNVLAPTIWTQGAEAALNPSLPVPIGDGQWERDIMRRCTSKHRPSSQNWCLCCNQVTGGRHLSRDLTEVCTQDLRHSWG